MNFLKYAAHLRFQRFSILWAQVPMARDAHDNWERYLLHSFRSYHVLRFLNSLSHYMFQQVMALDWSASQNVKGRTGCRAVFRNVAGKDA
jgi:hypothetical protein